MNINKLLLLIPLLLLAACQQGPEPRYAGPTGEGRFEYDPTLGIVRKDAAINGTEQGLYADAEKAFQQGRFLDCIIATIGLTQAFPDGSRAPDAILMRIRARMAFGRLSDAAEGFSKQVPLERWLFMYMAPDHDDRLRRLRASGQESRRVVDEFRALGVDQFLEKLRPEADALYDSGQLEMIGFDCRTLLTYYLPTLELRDYRRDVTELARDAAWLAYASRAYDLTINLCDELIGVNPPPHVKGDTLFIFGQAQRQNGAHVFAANTFGLLFSGAGLRDTDTRWRPYALMWQIQETLNASKGKAYDMTYYERALELIGEYELYLVENPAVPAALHEEFIALTVVIYAIMAWRDRNSADTYWRIGEHGAEAHYLERAAEWERRRDTRVQQLRGSR